MRNLNIEIRPLIFDNLLVYETKQLRTKWQEGLFLMEEFTLTEDIYKNGPVFFSVTSELKFESVGEYFNHINDIGKRTDLTAEQKLERIHEACRGLGDTKGDVTVVADKKYLTSEAFGSNGRPLVD